MPLDFYEESAFFVIPSADVTETMINLSTSIDSDDIILSNDGTETIVEAKSPIADVFLSYPMYDSIAILIELQNSKWSDHTAGVKN